MCHEEGGAKWWVLLWFFLKKNLKRETPKAHPPMCQLFGVANPIDRVPRHTPARAFELFSILFVGEPQTQTDFHLKVYLVINLWKLVAFPLLPALSGSHGCKGGC